MDPQALYGALAALDDSTAVRVIQEALQRRPELAPGVVGAAVPDLTYAPSDALARRRAHGTVKAWTQQGFGFIACPELKAVFGHDVYVHRHQISAFGPGAEVSFAVLLSKDLKPQAFDLQPTAAARGGGGCCAGAGGCMMGGGPTMGGGPIMGSGPMMMAKGGKCGDKGGGMMGGFKGGKGGGMMGKGPPAWAKGDVWLDRGEQGPAKRQRTVSVDARPDVQEVMGQFQGTIKSFNAKHGFGFIVCEALREQGYQKDVYLHHNQIGECQLGQTVLFTAYLNRKGQPQAMELQPLESR